jgi:diguanylate cyclase (GGDEF)-like protein
MGSKGLKSGSTYRMFSTMAVYPVFLAWGILAIYILSATKYYGFDHEVLKYFLSMEQSGIKFRALALLAPFALTAISYLINEKAKLLRKSLIAEDELRRRTDELEKANELLTRENSERRKAEEQLQHQAFYDSLTSLPNRTLFMDRLYNSLQRKKRHPDYVFAVLFLDVDRFKIINDALGHLIGDKLLVLLAHRLKKSIRSLDTVARFGGDEFAILVEDVQKAQDVDYLAGRINEEMRLPFQVLGREIFASFSIGIVLSSIGDYNRADDLVRDADIAMYNAKARGKACHVIFDAAMRAQAKTALWLETDLRKALDNGEFVIHYQPIVSVDSNRIYGFEALVRWHHPSRGMIFPLEFIAVAEETGIIVPIGFWVVREACRQMRRWQEQFPAYQHLTVSVNISAKLFSQPDFCEVIETILLETGLDPSRLRLEIVERMLIENPEPAAALLSRLKDLNVRFDVDDFGTGYSALNYLRQFPINGLKIDRSFINALTFDKDNVEIVKTIVALARVLNLEVIAEGIETTEQMEIFKTMKGGYAQGFFLFKPLEAEAAGKLLASENTAP